MKELNEIEIDKISGGMIWVPILSGAVAIYKVADIAYEFYQGLKAGAAGM